MAGVLGKAVPQANAPAPRVLGAGLPKAPGVLAKAKGGGKAGKGGGKGCKGGNIIQQGLALLQGANVNQVQQVIQGNNAAAAQVAGNLQCVGCHCFCFPGGGQQGPKWKAYQVIQGMSVPFGHWCQTCGYKAEVGYPWDEAEKTGTRMSGTSNSASQFRTDFDSWQMPEGWTPQPVAPNGYSIVWLWAPKKITSFELPPPWLGGQWGHWGCVFTVHWPHRGKWSHPSATDRLTIVGFRSAGLGRPL